MVDFNFRSWWDLIPAALILGLCWWVIKIILEMKAAYGGG